MLLYMVKTQTWPVDRLRALLDHVLDETGLSQAQIAALIPIDQSQLSRWRSGSSKPRYESLVALGDSLRRHYSRMDIGADELLTAAGYTTEPQELAPEATVEAKATAPDNPPDISAMEAEIARILASMSPPERARFERVVQEEEDDYQRRRIRHRLLFAKLMRGESIDESDLNP